MLRTKPLQNLPISNLPKRKKQFIRSPLLLVVSSSFAELLGGKCS